jgi:hypothetical protein
MPFLFDPTNRRRRDGPYPALSCCRPNPPFAELVRLSPMSVVDEIREEHGRRLRKPYGPRATTKITMTTLRSPGFARGAIGPDMKITPTS